MMKISHEELIGVFGDMTLLELAEFRRQFEERFDVSAALAPPAPPPPPVMIDAAEEEPEELTLTLEAAGTAKIQVIKTVRVLLPKLGLGEAKALVDAAPSVILSKVPAAEAMAAARTLEGAGAAVTLK